MIVVQAQVTDVDLWLLGFVYISVVKLLLDLEETILDFILNFWFQLLLHVVKLHILTFESF